MDGVGEIASLLEEYDAVLAAWSDPDADFENLGTIQAEIEGKIEAAGAWDLQRMVEIAMDALRLPSGDSEVGHLSGVRQDELRCANYFFRNQIFFF